MSDLAEIPNKNEDTKANVALLGLTITGGLALGLTVVSASFVSPAFRRICLPYVPATNKQIENVLKLCKNNGSSKLVDLGSGDGRIVFSAAKHGYLATGYELNFWLVLYSKIYSKLFGFQKTAIFKRQDLWKADLKCFDNIVIFGVPDMMNKLSLKLEVEMNSNSRVIACRFPFQKWVPVDEIADGIDSTWLYTKESFKKESVQQK
ncbi:ATP synthase subunit C lysine N-methyltransferase isoform X1 [Hydra vulgaris]|uniref:Protein FAM173B n=1 Tax=Hydra vulgaris TaxID=6087 RepID=T2MBE0_HYDVU|nr:ATP synthase subunit C lysine N-methyltransferase [Hydra vulgaris]